jgi:hypothetical protein
MPWPVRGWCHGGTKDPAAAAGVGGVAPAGSLRESWAGVPACEEVEVPELMTLEVSDVSDAWGVGPVFREDASAVRVNFHLANAGVSSSLQPIVNASDAGE